MVYTCTYAFTYLFLYVVYGPGLGHLHLRVWIFLTPHWPGYGRPKVGRSSLCMDGPSNDHLHLRIRIFLAPNEPGHGQLQLQGWSAPRLPVSKPIVYRLSRRRFPIIEAHTKWLSLYLEGRGFTVGPPWVYRGPPGAPLPFSEPLGILIPARDLHDFGTIDFGRTTTPTDCRSLTLLRPPKCVFRITQPQLRRLRMRRAPPTTCAQSGNSSTRSSDVSRKKPWRATSYEAPHSAWYVPS